MKKYKGYYIDHIGFNSKAEIDEFRKEQAIKAYKLAVSMFYDHPDMVHSNYALEKAEILNKEFGISWGDIEDIEISVYKNIA